MRINPMLLLALIAFEPSFDTSGSGADRPVLVRGDQSHSYQLTTTQHSPAGVEQTVVTFDLIRDDEGIEQVVIRTAARAAEPGTDLSAFEIDEECRSAFGGDAKAIGRFALRTGGVAFDDIVPMCMPEQLFIAVMDIVGFLMVQADPDLGGVHHLAETGDETRTRSFDASWSRPPDVRSGRLECAGGVTRLERLDAGRAYVRWMAEPMTVSIIRAVPGTDDMYLLMGGTETFALELEIDAGDGTLLSARSLDDTTRGKMWVPHVGNVAPTRSDWPTAGGQSLVMSRELLLELIP